MKKLFRKAISLLAAGTMLVSAFSGVAALAAGELYTTHVWETMENGKPSTLSANTTNTSDITFETAGKYGIGATLTKKTTLASEKKYPNVTVKFDDAITIDEAITNNLTVEVEFDFYAKDMHNDNTYIILAGDNDPSTTSGTDIKMSFKSSGQTKLYENSAASSGVDILGKSDITLTEYNTFKIIMHADATTRCWIMDSFSLNGTVSSTFKKNAASKNVGSNDFKKIFFQFRSDENYAGEIGLDNVSVTSYTTPSDGVSPVPNRHTYMDKVLTYKDTASTGAYNNALNVFEQDYITEADMNQAYYILEGRSDLYVIEDIYNGTRSLKITSNDSIGGTPVLVVAAFVNNKLDDIMIKTLDSIASGSSATISFDVDFTVADKASLRAYIFESFETLLPLAVARVE